MSTTTPQAAAQLGYGNGQIPDAALVAVQGRARLWPTVADAFERMRAAAAADGITLRITSAADAYRSLEQQQDAYARDPGGRFARPGTSEHGWGEAVDLELGAGVSDWLAANAARYGFANTVRSEGWHWGYVGGASITGTGGTVRPLSILDPIGDAAGAAGGVLGDAGDAITSGLRRVTIIGLLLAGGAALVVLGADQITGRRASSTIRSGVDVATRGATAARGAQAARSSS